MRTLDEIIQEMENGKTLESKEATEALKVYRDLYFSLAGSLSNAIKEHKDEITREYEMRTALRQSLYKCGAALDLPPSVYIEKKGDMREYVTKDGYKIHHK